jgi:hypothetical protein
MCDCRWLLIRNLHAGVLFDLPETHAIRKSNKMYYAFLPSHEG